MKVKLGCKWSQILQLMEQEYERHYRGLLDVQLVEQEYKRHYRCQRDNGNPYGAISKFEGS
jgi:hypothetical protein